MTIQTREQFKKRVLKLVDEYIEESLDVEDPDLWPDDSDERLNDFVLWLDGTIGLPAVGDMFNLQS